MANLQLVTKDFLLHCRIEKHLSSKTIKAYTTDLRQFVSFVHSDSTITLISEVGKTEIRNYLSSLA